MPGPTGEDVEEQVVRFGADEAIFGIVTRHPSPAQRLGVAIVLVNGGSNHRVGINRNYTDWARRWASSGYTVLRFDIRGLGDSPPQRSKDLGVLYREETRQDVIAAIDFLTHSQQVDRFVCLGLCAGGYQSFHAALEDPRVTGVIMLNPLRFRPVDPAGHADIDLKHAPAAHYARVWRDRARWRRLLHGQVDILGIVGSMVRRWARSAWARLRSLCGAAPQGTTWLAARLLRLTGRGCRVCIVFDSSDPMCERTQQELINDRAHLEATGKFFFETIDGTDHIFSPLWSQERLTERLDAIMQTWSLTTNVSDGRPRETSDHGHKDGNFLPHG